MSALTSAILPRLAQASQGPKFSARLRLHTTQTGTQTQIDILQNTQTDRQTQTDTDTCRPTERQPASQPDSQPKMLTVFLIMAVIYHIAALTCWRQERHWQAGTQPQPQQGRQRWSLTGFCNPPEFCCPAHPSHMPPRRAATIGQPNCQC